MKSRVNLVVVAVLASLMVGCASMQGEGGQDRGVYGSIGVGRMS